MSILTIDRARELLSLDDAAGVLYWRIPRRGRWKGFAAGSVGRSGYLILSLDNKRYQAHRVIWLMTYGRWPDALIDHINGDKLDNRICNLREATHSQNTCNRRGVTGVTLHKGGKFQAQIKARGRRYYLGLYAKREDAEAAYRDASLRLHGEFGAAA